MRFTDRTDASKKLAVKLEKYRNNKEVVVLGLPRGGVVTANQVAKKLDLPMDIIVTRKIGAPLQPEMALGAITQTGNPILDHNLIKIVGINESNLQETIEQERLELKRRLKIYRAGRQKLDLSGKIAILVDDGLATGATMLAAIVSARDLGARKIVVAVPVSPVDTLNKIEKFADETVCLYTPEVFFSVGAFYESFLQVQDQEVVDLLKNARYN